MLRPHLSPTRFPYTTLFRSPRKLGCVKCTNCPSRRSLVTCLTWSSGCDSARRSNSPPVYPEAPMIETEVVKVSALSVPSVALSGGAFCQRDRGEVRRLVALPAVGGIPPALRHVETEIHHPLGNVDVGRRDAVAELHRVVHFVDEQSAIGIF